MFQHSIKWIKKNYGYGRSGPPSYLQLHLPHILPSPRYSAVILSTKAAVLSFIRLFDFFPATWLNLLPLRLSLKVWPVIWLKLNDIQEISGERERGRHSKDHLLGNQPEKSERRCMVKSFELWIAHHQIIYFCFSQPQLWPRSYLQSWRQRRKAVAGKGCGRRPGLTL